MEMSGQLDVPAVLRSEKDPPVPVEWETGRLQSRSGRFGEGKNSFHLPGIESRIVQPVALSLY
jgi:hypothetical protein